MKLSAFLVLFLGLAALSLLGWVYWRGKSKPKRPWVEAEANFGHRGMQYYVGGRFLALSQQFPVCASLLHHAVEMFLKSALCRTSSRGDLHALKHNLRRAWLSFKAANPDTRLDSLDAAVSALNKFERIRYPDEEIKKGSVGTFVLERSHIANFQGASAAKSPKFHLVLEDVDELIQLIFEVGRMNPHFYLNGTAASARALLNDRNAHPFPPAP